MAKTPSNDPNEYQAQDTYFRNRGIDPAYYASFQLPAYLTAELPRDKNAKILDIGCGFGQMLTRLREKGYANIRGIDIGAESVSFCRSKGLDVEKIESIPGFAGEHATRYDLILMSHVLEHIPKSETLATLTAIRSLLAPGGSFIVMVPNAQSNTGVYWMYEDFTHHLLFTAGSLRYAMLSAGFAEVTFLDPQCLAGLSFFGKLWRRFWLRLYSVRYNFWNRVTASSFHRPSPRIFSFELKARGRN